VTTEKDAINLGRHMEGLDLLVAKMQMSLQGAEAAVKFMLGTIAERRDCTKA
jgi:hypothetical protein